MQQELTKIILGLGLATLLFGAAYGRPLAAAHSHKTKPLGCHTPADEGFEPTKSSAH